MLDALSFVLFGKPFRNINKPQLVSSINGGGMIVELEFNVKGKEYLIRRGLKPGIFEIHLDGKMLNQDARAKDYQLVLEEQIIRMNYKSFGQIVVLGSSTFVPFMQLGANHRRTVIEELLDIQIFTTMNSLLKSKVDDNKDAISRKKYQIDIVKKQIELANTHTEELRSLRVDRVKEIKSEMTEKIAVYTDAKDKIAAIAEETTCLPELLTKRADHLHAQAAIVAKIADIDYDIIKLEEAIEFFEHTDRCATCHQDITSETSQHQIKMNNEAIASRRDSAKNFYVERDEHQGHIDELLPEIRRLNELNATQTQHKYDLDAAMATLHDLAAELTKAQKDVEEISTIKLDDLQQKLVTYIDDNTKNLSEADVLRVAASLLKDGGIKSKIIKQYVPIINQLVNKYLSDMEFFVQFELDEQFSETIKSRYRDVFTYNSFSEGEKARIDLALMFTWRQVAKMRSTNATNLLILDEVFDGSLDGEGTDALTDILNIAGTESNIIVISHKGDKIQDKFERVLRVEKRKNYSVLIDD